MIFCRICLSPNIYEEIAWLELNENGEKLNFTDVITFCTDIKIHNCCSKSYLCMYCYNQVVSFYNFKQLALKNDKYLQSLELNEDKETELFQNKDVQNENICDNGIEVRQKIVDNIISEIKEEIEFEAADCYNGSQVKEELVNTIISDIKQEVELDAADCDNGLEVKQELVDTIISDIKEEVKFETADWYSGSQVKQELVDTIISDIKQEVEFDAADCDNGLEVKQELVDTIISDIKEEVEFEAADWYSGSQVKQELVDTIISDIKQEVELHAVDDHIESDDGFLGVIIQNKEIVIEFDNTPLKRGRGRPKKIKVGTQKKAKKVCGECGKTIKNQCNICSKIVTSRVKLRNHMIVDHHTNRLQCIYCDELCTSQFLLDLHLYPNNTCRSKGKPCKCANCEKKFKTKDLDGVS